MPSSKKLPAVTRKKVTASARARTSPKKTSKVSVVDQSGSYLRSARSVSSKPFSSQASASATQASTNDAILAMLQKLDDSNKMLSQRLDKDKLDKNLSLLCPLTPDFL